MLPESLATKFRVRLQRKIKANIAEIALRHGRRNCATFRSEVMRALLKLWDSESKSHKIERVEFTSDKGFFVDVQLYLSEK